ncbi:hypothetical protein NQ317_016862, partial [Molorchus minor]
KYKPKVGTYEIKSMKRLWEYVARDLSNLFKITVSATKCENKWKVLERSYKKVLDNNNRTGRGLKVFDDNIILNNESASGTKFQKDITEKFIAHESADNSQNVNIFQTRNKENLVEPVVELTVQETPQKNILKRKRSIRSVTSSYKKRNEILLELKKRS